MFENISQSKIEEIFTEKIMEYVIGAGVTNVLKSKKMLSLFQKTKKVSYIKEIELDISERRIVKGILSNIETSRRWSREIKISSLIEDRNLQEVFVGLDLYVSPLKERADVSREPKKIPFIELIKNTATNSVIFGRPGAGKTTLATNLFTRLLNGEQSDAFTCPLVIRFRELTYPHATLENNFGVFDILLSVLGITQPDISNIILQGRLEADTSDPREFERKLAELEKFRNELQETYLDMLVAFLDQCRFLIIFEGFDEIPQARVKDQIEKDLLLLSRMLNHTRFVLTCRNSGFHMVLSNTKVYEISPLNIDQVETLSKKWLKDPRMSEEFLNRVRDSPFFDTSRIPLTLVYLCAIFDHYGDVPSKPRYVYEQILMLLSEKWDLGRGIKERTTKFKHLDPARVREFLAQLAFELSISQGQPVFTTFNLISCYKRICMNYSLPPHEAEGVVDQIEQQNGLMIRVGVGSFQFAHKSLQEYLCARFLTGGLFPEKEVLYALPEEMAIVISLTTNPGGYLFNLIRYIDEFDSRFWFSFIERLSIEKPDFDGQAHSIIFFYSLLSWPFSMTSTNSLHRVRSRFQKQIEEICINTNLRIGMPAFLHHYSKQASNGNRVIFLKHDSESINDLAPKILDIERRFLFGYF